MRYIRKFEEQDFPKDGYWLLNNPTIERLEAVGYKFNLTDKEINFLLKNDLIIDPNPVTDILNIDSEKFSGKLEVKLIDLNGKVVQTSLISDFNGHYALSLTSLAKGIYILKLNGENMSYSQKINIK